MENTQNEVNLKKGVNSSNNMATNQASLDDKLLEAYVGKKYQIIKNKKFSVPAFFFGYLYTAYRKYYSLTFIILLINFLVALFVKFATFNDATLATISAVTNIVLDIIVSFNFNKWYLKDAEKRVQKIKSDNRIPPRRGGIGQSSVPTIPRPGPGKKAGPAHRGPGRLLPDSRSRCVARRAQ